MKVKVSTIHAVLIYLLVFFSTTYISYNPIRYILLVAVALMMLSNAKVLFVRDNRAINVSMAAFCFAVLAISYINRNGYSERNPFLAAVVFVVTLVEFTMTVEIFCQRDAMSDLLHVFYWMTFWIVAATDLLILFTNIHLRFGGDVFLVGTKFSVIYMHFYLIAFFFADKGIRLQSMSKRSFMDKMVLIFLLVITMMMSIKLGTATGIIGTVALMIFLWISDTNVNCILNTKCFLVAFLASVLFAIFVEVVLSNSLVTYVITQLLGKDITLTFRTVIYSMFPKVMKNHWLWGFGYGTGYEVLMRYGIVDAQNGIFDWVQQVGVLGTLLLTVWLSIAMKKSRVELDINDSSVKSLTALVYVFILLATVEITYSSKFLAVVVLLYGAKLQDERALK